MAEDKWVVVPAEAVAFSLANLGSAGGPDDGVGMERVDSEG